MFDAIIYMPPEHYYMLCAALLMLAAVHVGTMDRVIAGLGAGLVASVVAAEIVVPANLLLLVIFAIDLGIILWLGEPWTKQPHKRAWVASCIGGGKMLWTSLAWSYSSGVSFFTYALVLNCAFLLQIVVAGGFVDAIGTWLDHHWKRLAPRSHHAVFDVEGK